MAITTAALLNSIRNLASTDYADRIPAATKTNITAVGNAITSYAPSANEFLNILINKIGKTIISNRMANNPLKIFKKGELPNGKDIEEIFIEMAPSEAFDQEGSETTLFQRVLPNIKTIYHRENRRDLYTVTISESMLKTAFTSDRAMKSFVGKIIESLYSGDQYDEFTLMKELLAKYQANYYEVTTPDVTDEATGKNFIKAVRQMSLNLGFMETTYNKQGVKTYTPTTNQVLFLHKNISSIIDVDVLAYAFNGSKVDFTTQVVIVDDFGSMTNTLALLTDADFLQVYDTEFKMTSQYNGKGLYWNYFLHHWQVLSTSQFCNAVRFALPAV